MFKKLIKPFFFNIYSFKINYFSLHLDSKDKQSSEILGASPNCNIKKSRLLNIEQLNPKIDNYENLVAQKENINQFVQFDSSDFSDIEDDFDKVKSHIENDFDKLKSPKHLDVNTPVKIQKSPILSKKKNNLKKSSSIISNASTPSVTSSNDSKISSSLSTSSLEKINEVIDCNEFEAEPPVEPLKSLENTQLSTTLNSCDIGKGYNVLSVSKINCGKTEFHEKGKKLKQTTLTFTKVPPVIDLAKIDSYDTCNYETHNKVKTDKIWTETYDCQILNKIINQDKQKINTNSQIDVPHKNDNEIKSDNLSNSNNVKCNGSSEDDELVETSPTEKECSKLRNKLGFQKKLESKQIRVKDPDKINNEALSNLGSESSNSLKKTFSKRKMNDAICKSDNMQLENTSTLKAHKDKDIYLDATSKNLYLLKSQKNCISDETFFSPVESSTSKNNTNHYDVDLTDFQDEIECATPPTKRMLLNSFDM